MKGIVLAGGAGTRLHPITKGISKQLLPIYDKPMIYYPISVLMLAGIREILIINTPEEQPMFKRLLGDGSQFGVKLEYAVQEKPNGLAEAFIIGEKFIGNDAVCLILGDNIFHGPGFYPMLRQAVFNAEEIGLATVFGYYVNDPTRYGVVDFVKEYEGHYLVRSIEEKPKEPKSNYAVVGLYFYPNDVVKIAKEITPSERGELEITAVNNKYLNYETTYYSYPLMNNGAGYKTIYKIEDYTDGEPEIEVRTSDHLSLQLFNRGFAWFDTGTFDSLSEASNYVETIEKRQGLQVACLEEIAYNNGWITKEQLKEAGNSMMKNDYGQYLLSIANNTLSV